MEILPVRKRKKRKSKGPNNRLSLSVWLFYIGIVSLSLTSVTFSRYSTVVRGTISVQVAAVFTVSFVDGEKTDQKHVYEGQTITKVPVCSDIKETDSDGNITVKYFLGWSLDKTDIIDPETVSVHGNLTFYAIYGDAKPIQKAPLMATPSNAATPSDASSATSVIPKKNTAVTVPSASTESGPEETTEAIPEEAKPSLASPSNSAAMN